MKTKILMSPTANISGVVTTLRHAGFDAYTETDKGIETLHTNATMGQAVLCFGHSNWIDSSFLAAHKIETGWNK